MNLRSIGARISIVGLGVGLGRVSGLARDASALVVGGLSSSSDVVFVLLTVPDLVLVFILGGAVQQVLIPHFGRQEGGPFWRFIMVFSAFGLLASGLAWIGAPFFARVLAPGFGPAAANALASALPIVCMAMPLGAISIVSVARLHADQRFAIPAASAGLYNIAVIGAIFLMPGDIIHRVSFGVVVAAISRTMWLIGAVLILIPTERKVNFRRKTSRGTWREIGHAVAAAGGLHVIPYVARSAASLAGPGAVAAFAVAWKLIEVPTGAILGAAVTAVYPSLARDRHSMPVASMMATQWVVGFAFFVSAATFSVEVTTMLFGYGGIDRGAALHVAGYVATMSAAIPLLGILHGLVALHNSGATTRTASFATTIGLVVNIGALVVVWALGILGPFGIGLAVAAGLMVAVSIAWACLPEAGRLAPAIRMSLMPTAAMVAMAFALFWMPWWRGSPVAAILGGIMVMGVGLLLLHARSIKLPRRGHW